MKSALSVIEGLVGPVPPEISIAWLENLSRAAEAQKRNGCQVLPELYWITENADRCVEWMRGNGISGGAFVGPFRPNPFARGQSIVIPKGTKVEHRVSVRELRRSTRVTLASVNDGYTHYDHGPLVYHPSVVWAGSGGYWSTVNLGSNPQVAAAGGAPAS